MPENDLPSEANHQLSFWLLNFARFLAVVFWASTVAALALLAFGRRIERRLIVRSGNHTVICGLGPVGKELALQQIKAKHKVVVIDRGENHLATKEVVQAGASLIDGNPSNRRLLEKARASTARLVCAASERDTVNLSTGLAFIDLLKTKPPAKPLHMYFHVEEPQLRLEVQTRGWLADSAPNVHGGVFSIYDRGARVLLLEHPLDGHGIRVDDNRLVQLILVGFGLMGEAILVRAALVGHYANLKKIRTIVFDPDAKNAFVHFQLRYPNFANVAEVEFYEADPLSPDTHDRISEICANPAETLSTVVIPIDHKVPAFSLAVSLSHKLQNSVPIRCRLDENLEIASAIQKHARGDSGAFVVTPFNPLTSACHPDNWMNEKLDQIAMELHKDYVFRLTEEGRASGAKSNAAPWEELQEQFRESNRQAADHIWVKLRALGYHSARANTNDPGELITRFDDNQIEILARMEHRRWMAERFLSGWQLGQKDAQKRLSPYLIEWEDLSRIAPHIQEYDRNSARLIPGLLAGIGFEIRR